ncbi:MAG: hypothetical protein ACKO3P_09880, partial [Planctomycetaceae bacterium]
MIPPTRVTCTPPDACARFRTAIAWEFCSTQGPAAGGVAESWGFAGSPAEQLRLAGVNRQRPAQPP